MNTYHTEMFVNEQVVTVIFLHQSPENIRSTWLTQFYISLCTYVYNCLLLTCLIFVFMRLVLNMQYHGKDVTQTQK
jgi:hypothetical protein